MQESQVDPWTQMMFRVSKSGIDTFSNIRDHWDFEELLDCNEWLEFQADLEHEAYEKINKT